jgi:predicted chitinase
MITRQLFDRLFPTKGLDPRKYNLVRQRDLLITELNRILPKYGITTYLRICAFFANCGVETDYFKTSIEYASGWDYDISVNRAKAIGLGNTAKGDGPKYKGRSPMQTTGKFNYEQVQKAIGKQLGIDVVANPELLADVAIGVEAACIFWRDHDLNHWADSGDFRSLSGIVNRGKATLLPLHWPKRLALYKLCLSKIPKDIDLQSNEQAQPIEQLADTNQPDTNLIPNTVPTEPAPETDTAAAPSSSMSLQDFSSKYLRHTPADKVKNVLLVIAGRAGTGIGVVWNLGVHGKLLTVLVLAILLAPIIYAIYFYRWRIVGWGQTIADTLLGNG